MIDREARNHTAQNLRDFISGKITNDTFDMRQVESGDPGVNAIDACAWLLYSDMEEHYLTGDHQITNQDRQECLKWILFLDSNDDYVWPHIYLPVYDPRLRRAEPVSFLNFFRSQKKNTLHNSVVDNFLAAGDYAVWPFASRRQYKDALRNPRRLSGRV